MLKKIIIGILGLVVLLVAGLGIFGWMNPSISYESTVEINKPRDVVWAYFSDESKMGEWLDGFKKVETISGNKLEEGSKHRLTFIEGGEEIVIIETVKEIREPEKFVMELDNEIISSVVDVTLTEKDGKTIYSQKENVVGSNILWRIMFAAMKSTFEGRSQEQLNKLKANIEKL